VEALLEAAEILLLRVDPEERLVDVSPASKPLLGYAPEELIGLPISHIIPPNLPPAVRFFRRLRSSGEHIRQRLLLRARDGSHLTVHVDAAPLHDAAGAQEGIAIAARQVPPEFALANAPGDDVRPQRDEQEVIERLPAVVYIADPGPDGQWRYVSGQIKDILGYTSAEWMADRGLWLQRVHPEDRDRVLAEEERDTATPGTWVSSEYRLLARDGRAVWVHDDAVLRFEADGMARYTGLLTDVTERKALEAKLEFFAEHDPLTGLLNRRRIMSEIEIELHRARRTPEPSSLLVADLDGLKSVNDSRGHAVGDVILCVVAEVLLGRLRGSDSVARVGGDEFVALLRGTDTERAVTVAQELVEAVGPRIQAVTRGAGDLGLSIGVAGLDPARQPAELLNAADRAMYEAKRRGGGTVAVADPDPS